MPSMVRNIETLAKLAELKESLGLGSKTAVIDLLVADYLPTQEQLEKTQKKLSDLEHKYFEMVRILKEKKSVDEKFNALLSSLPDRIY